MPQGHRPLQTRCLYIDVAKYQTFSIHCDSFERRCTVTSVSVSICLFVCTVAYLRNLTLKFRQIVKLSVARFWSGGAWQHVMYFRFVADVMFAGNGPCKDDACRTSTHRRIGVKLGSQLGSSPSNNFPTRLVAVRLMSPLNILVI